VTKRFAAGVAVLAAVLAAPRSEAKTEQPKWPCQSGWDPKSPRTKLPPRVDDLLLLLASFVEKSETPFHYEALPGSAAKDKRMIRMAKDPRVDLTQLLGYVASDGLRFTNFFNEQVILYSDTVAVASISRRQLSNQVNQRRGRELFWLMVLAYDVKYFSGFGGVERTRGRTTEICLSNDYLLTFKDEGGLLQLSRLQYLRDADGGD
jgi:hypothetical protein